MKNPSTMIARNGRRNRVGADSSPKGAPAEGLSPASAPAEGFMPVFGVLCLLAFCMVMMSQKLPLGEVSALGALLAAGLRKGKIGIPLFYRWYLLYFLFGVAGLLLTRYPDVVRRELIEVLKFVILGFAMCNILTTQRSCHLFAVGYLALFALFPVRGTIFNYLQGISTQGRFAWNFFFANPNDLAMACLLPLGLCGYFVAIDSKKWIKWSAGMGLIVLVGVQMLTQSRGAMLALGGGLLYFVIHTKRRVRALLTVGALVVVAAAIAPNTVWERVAGLSKLSSGDMAQVDPEGSAAGRKTLMLLAARAAKENPLFGVGFGAYSLENARLTAGNPSVGRDERGERDAHSTYLRAAAETGLIGGLCILLFMATAIAFCRRARRSIGRNKRDAHALGVLSLEASMIAFAVGAFVNSAERSTFFVIQFLVPCAMAAMLLHLYGSDDTAVEKPRHSSSARR